MAARFRRLRLIAPVAFVLLIPVAVGACGGSPPDLGTVEPAEPIAGLSGPWKLVQVEGTTLSGERIEALRVEIAPDGTSVTAFFQGGDPNCYTVAGVEIEWEGPAVSAVTILYGLRLGKLGCNAALASLAIRIALGPPPVP